MAAIEQKLTEKIAPDLAEFSLDSRVRVDVLRTNRMPERFIPRMVVMRMRVVGGLYDDDILQTIKPQAPPDLV